MSAGDSTGQRVTSPSGPNATDEEKTYLVDLDITLTVGGDSVQAAVAGSVCSFNKNSSFMCLIIAHQHVAMLPGKGENGPVLFPFAAQASLR